VNNVAASSASYTTTDAGLSVRRGFPSRQLTPVREWGPFIQLAVALWMMIVLVISVRTLLSPLTNSVYPVFAEAARHWQAVENLYDSREHPYRYSPVAALLFVPLSALPDSLAGTLWRLMNVGVYLGALGWWAKRAVPLRLTGDIRALIFLLIIPLSVGSLNNGQSNALILGLLLVAVTGAGCGRWNLSSGCVALATLFKIYPLVVGLLLAVVYPRRFAPRLALGLLLGLCLPFCFQSPDYVLTQYAGWFRHVVSDDRQILPRELWYRDLRLLCHVWHVSLGRTAYLSLQVMGVGVIAAVCAVGQLRSWNQKRLLLVLFVLSCCWMTVLGPATESCTYILLAPALAWACLESRLVPHARWTQIGILCSYALFTLTQAAPWFRAVGRQFHSWGPQPLAGLVLCACYVFMELRNAFR
jgi:hypothetical protein